MKIRTIGLAAALTGAALITQASACVTVSPPAPPVTLLGSCHVPGSLWSYYTFHVGGDAKTRGYFWLHTSAGDSQAEFHLWGDIMQAYAVGSGWVYFAADLDDNGNQGVSAPGGAFSVPTADCAQSVSVR